MDFRKRTVPIVSGNIRYLGLTVPEWVFTLCPVVVYVPLVPEEFVVWCFVGNILLIIFYSMFIASLEENILLVLLKNSKIQSIVQGIGKKPLPVHELRGAVTIMRKTEE